MLKSRFVPVTLFCRLVLNICFPGSDWWSECDQAGPILCLVDNQVVQPRPYAKAFTADDCTPPEFLPISGMDLDEYYSHVHDEMNTTQTPNISTVQLPIPPTDCHKPDPASSLLGTFEIVPGVNAAQVENIFDNTSPSLHQAGSSSVGGNVEVGQVGNSSLST